jgi:DNA-binding response OmpR family regulator
MAAVASERPNLVVLDLNLGAEDGFALLPALRAASAAPVLILSVRASEEDVVRGLDLGADDYLTKPFSPKTLLARVRALLRRAGGSGPEELAAGPFRLDLERRLLAIEGRPPARLTPLELRLVQALLASAGEPVVAERLIAHVWGGRAEGDRQLLKQLVRRLRQKIERDPSQPELLETDTGVGYRLRLA